MTNKLQALSLRSRFIAKQDGLLTLIARSLLYTSEYFFHFGTFILYEDTPDLEDKANNLPELKDISVQIISTREQADKLAANGLDLNAYTTNATEKLDKGAIAFCIFVGGEFAHVGWVTTNQRAKDAFEPYPFHVDFLNNEAGIAGGMTIRKYRGKGLAVYSVYVRLKYLGEKGIVKVRLIADIRNIAIQMVEDKIGGQPYAKGRYKKILGWHSWKEMPLH